jgi:undecaprenyl diphosphate synthase
MTIPELEGLKIPTHVAIVMDGNGRWAKSRGLPRVAGHRAGTENLRRVIKACVRFGIKYLTIYAFSTENWERPKDEVDGLMRILADVIDNELTELNKQGVQLHHVGILERLEPELARKIAYAQEITGKNDRLVLNIAWNYGGRDEIVNAVRRIIKEGIPAEKVCEDTIDKYLFTAGSPDPDLLIRTAGEMRVSNFLLWQIAYTEFYVTPAYWPDFDENELLKAIKDYSKRDRRYGRVNSDCSGES